ncbi:MAG: D-alanyl-D-alanine carboxypeptidase [Methylobacterium sp.]|nr:D-alanyl-D-alanine carboxypeptidase [Methylobacterium sp.]
MKLSRLLSIALLALSSGGVLANAPPPPTIAARSYVLLDFNSNTRLAQQAADERIEPASLTKLMTAYLAFKALQNGHLQLSQTVPVSEYAWKGGGGGCGGAQGSCMFIDPKSVVTVDQLLHGMIVVSGNDASVALAEAVAGTEQTFADLMNKEAVRLGMKSTHFMNATGLPDPGHYTTASDLALLAAALVRDFPDQYKRLYALKEYSFNNIKQMNRNRLLWVDPNVDGMKTGHTAAAGYCLIASARRGDTRLISVVLGTPSDATRAAESQKLLNFGFLLYESRLVYRKGQAVSRFKLWKGHADQLSATVQDDLYLALPRGQYDKVKADIVSQQPLIAPVKAGQVIGKIHFTLDGKPLMTRNLVAAEDVAIAGLFGRLWDGLKLMIR